MNFLLNMHCEVVGDILDTLNVQLSAMMDASAPSKPCNSHVGWSMKHRGGYGRIREV